MRVIKKIQSLATSFSRCVSSIDRYILAVVRILSLYAVPLIIAIVSLIALTTWDNFYTADNKHALSMRILGPSDVSHEIALNSIFNKLKDAPTTLGFDTKRAEEPIWIGIDTLGQDPGNRGLNVVEFPSRHAVKLTCWDALNLELLGEATHGRFVGAVTSTKAGFSLKLPRPEMQVICRGNFVGPAHLSAVLWSESQLTRSAQQFHRASGLLDGGLIVLAIFVLLTALISRQGIYVLFSAWLILNMRVAELSAGWDMQWLGQILPDSWLLPSRSLAIALYSLVTVNLFLTLFAEELKNTLYAVALKVTRWFCLLLVPAAYFLSYKQFLPIMWVMTALTLVLMTAGISRIFLRSRSRVALWYAASLGVATLSSLSEVVAAALGVRDLSGIANSVTAALASSLLAAIAIAEQMRQEHNQFIATQAEMQHMVDAMPIGLFTLDSFGRCLSANPTFIAMLVNSNVQVGDESWKRHFAEGTWSQIHQMLDTKPDVEMEIRSKAGDERFLIRATRSHEKIQGVLQDITETSKATENLKFLANNDPLTKVFNRRGIEKMFKSAHAKLEQGQPLALAYLDLDRFKLINDMFGHASGDAVLRQVCDRITGLLARGQSIGRVGGDEFVLIMPDTNIALATVIARGIVSSIGDVPFRVTEKAFHVRGSIGLVEITSNMNMQEAISTADRACREAKDKHTDGLVVYEKNSAAFDERRAELQMIEELSSDAATHRLFIEMQPIMSLKQPYESRNVEVLLRMRDKDGKTIPAGRVIGAAEKSGRTGVIDRWVLSTTLAWIETNFEELENMQFVCINLNGASLNDERFLDDAVDMLIQYPDAAKRICMEITESVALHDLDNTRRFIDSVRSYGARVGLDDFGAGYTSFSYLKQLPADVLKIDGSFVVNINEHPTNVSIVETIVNLASNLGMKTIAEWAEDIETVKTLAEIGVDYVQGFVISKSRPPEEILAVKSFASFIAPGPLTHLIDELSRNEVPVQAKLIELGRFRDPH
ncbi:MAG: EAL domain-containing protein [bacterium]|nr:EAL domain-containing protein [bacterium]